MAIFTKLFFACNILLLPVLEAAVIYRPILSGLPKGKGRTWKSRNTGYIDDLTRIKRAVKALSNTVEDLEDLLHSPSSPSEKREAARENSGSGESLSSYLEGQESADMAALQTLLDRWQDTDYEYILIRVPVWRSAHRHLRKGASGAHRRQKRVVSRPNLSELCEYQNRFNPKRRRLCPLLS